jgi:hypothetical protein
MTTRKCRVRKHIIADLSVNHIQYQLLKAGHTIVVDSADYGYDGSITTFSATGEIENGYVFIQLKATDHIARRTNKTGLSFSLSKKDIELWYNEPFPVYLVLFDSIKEIGYWIYLQKYFLSEKITPATIVGASLTVRIDAKNVFDAITPGIWRDHKNAVLAQIAGKVLHA